MRRKNGECPQVRPAFKDERRSCSLEAVMSFYSKIAMPCIAFLMVAMPASGQSADAVRMNAQVHEMQSVEDAWDTAVNKHDQFGLENVLAPQLVDIAATGDVTTRNQDLAKLYTKGALPLSVAQKVITVRTLNEGYVLVNGTYSMRWPNGNSADTIDEKGVFTQIFQAVNGRWMCVSSQRTVVADQMPQTKVKAAAPRAKSNAAEPFHVPLFYKGAQPAQPPASPNQPQPQN
jgi:hypothetical protein